MSSPGANVHWLGDVQGLPTGRRPSAMPPPAAPPPVAPAPPPAALLPPPAAPLPPPAAAKMRPVRPQAAVTTSATATSRVFTGRASYPTSQAPRHPRGGQLSPAADVGVKGHHPMKCANASHA